MSNYRFYGERQIIRANQILVERLLVLNQESCFFGIIIKMIENSKILYKNLIIVDK